MRKKSTPKSEKIEDIKVFDEENASKTFLQSKEDSGQNDEIKTVEENNAIREQKSTGTLKSTKKIERKTKAKAQKDDEDLIIKKIKKHFNDTVKETKEIVQENKQELIKSSSQKIEEAQTDVRKKSSKVKIYFYTLCFLINVVCFSFVLFLLSSSARNIGDILAGGSVSWFVVLLFSFVLVIALETTNFTLLLQKSSKRIRVDLAFKTITIGRFYDSITPLKSGGQPFQISYLHKFGENGKSSASVPVSRYMINQFIYLFAIIVLIFNISKVGLSESIGSNIVSVMAYIGLIVQVIWLLSLILLSYSKKIGPVMVIGVLKFLSKIRIIKNYRIAYVRVLRFVKEYQITMRKCLSNLGHFLWLFISSLFIMAIKWSTPFLIYCAFNGFNFSIFFQTFAYSMLMELALGLWILPGNVIFADLVFLTLFRPFFNNSTIFWALLFWRILTYYGYIILGALVKCYDIVKYDWLKKPIKKSTRVLTNSNIKKQKL